MTEAFGSPSMATRLRSVLLCSTEVAGWNSDAAASRWQELGYLRAPDSARAVQQWTALCARLDEAGVRILTLPSAADLSLDAVYAHDASLVAATGALLLRMGKTARAAEPQAHAAVYRSLGIPILGVLEAPATAEAGDMVWLDETTLLVGHGFRTNAAGIEQLRTLLRPQGVEVLEAPLPHGSGPDACLHLMSLMSVLDAKTVLVDLPWLTVPTVGLLRQRGYKLIDIDASERQTLACNVLALGQGRLLALDENRSTNERLRTHGFSVSTFAGSELCINGGGGPTCLTRPILRA